MRRKSSIVKLSLFSLAIILGFLLAFCSFRLWGFNNYTGFANTMDKGVDLTGGVSILYEVEKDSDISNFGTAINSTADSLSGILRDNGYTPTVSREGLRKIRVNVANVTNVDAVLSLLEGVADVSITMDGSTILSSEHFDKAVATATASGYGVAISLTDEGAKLFSAATTNNQGSTMNIMNGDKNILGNGIRISDPITDGQFVISTSSSQSADSVASQIMAGKYRLELNVKSVQTITENSGKTVLIVGVVAGAVGLALIIALSIFLYGLFGVAIAIANLGFSVSMLFIMAMFPWVQLSVAGVVGIIASIGIASAFNITICERIKEEYRNGKSILSATHYGFRKSLRQIIDTGIILIITNIILIFFGNIAVKNFAITMIIGICIALLFSLVFARMFINYMVRINQTDSKLYRLVRGEGYEDIDADQNDAATERELLEQQRKAAERKGKEASSEGGSL